MISRSRQPQRSVFGNLSSAGGIDPCPQWLPPPYLQTENTEREREINIKTVVFCHVYHVYTNKEEVFKLLASTNLLFVEWFVISHPDQWNTFVHIHSLDGAPAQLFEFLEQGATEIYYLTFQLSLNKKPNQAFDLEYRLFAWLAWAKDTISHIQTQTDP